MRLLLILLFFTANSCAAQKWQAELMGGVSGYSGDLAELNFEGKTLRPAVNLNLKYVTSGNFIIFRAGVGYGKIAANDKNNKDRSFLRRNLNFKTSILEANVCLEVNMLDPQIYAGYPYAFAGGGVYRFNPYTYDKNNKKTFLQPLGTEGQGLPLYPDRKVYALTQFCVPLGVGWKYKLNEKFEVGYEIGVRLLFTDYLDDVSTTYVDPEVLLAARGEKSAELSYRKTTYSGSIEGIKRGNPDKNDMYYFTGIKLTMTLGSE